jgi:hypothetical protein
MESRDFALIEMLIFTGLALAIGVWQLVSVNRELKKTRAEQARTDAEADSDRPGG